MRFLRCSQAHWTADRWIVPADVRTLSRDIIPIFTNGIEGVGMITIISIGDFWDAWWQQTYQVNSIVLGNLRKLRATLTMEIYLVGLLPPLFQSLPLMSSHTKIHLKMSKQYCSSDFVL